MEVTMSQKPKQDIFILWNILLVFCLCSAGANVYKIPIYKSREIYHNHRIVKRAAGNKTNVVQSEFHNLRGQPGMGYYIEMGIGTPPQKFNILVDTGSSNFAVAAYANEDLSHYFNESMSSTYSYDGTDVDVPYTQGSWEGTLAHDRVTIPSLPTINVTADIAFITDSRMFFQNGSHWQGILGLAYSEIVRPDKDIEVFMDTMKKQSPLPDMFSMQLCGVIDLANATNVNTGGTLLFGGVDKSLYKGNIQYAAIYKEWYYEVIITDFSVNGKSLGFNCKEYNFDKTIVDSGTTNLRLPVKVYKKFVTAVSENSKASYGIGRIPYQFWLGQRLLCWPPFSTPWKDFPSVSIELASSMDTTFTLEISPQQYMREVQDLDRSSTDDCYKFAVSPSESGTVIGAVIMEGFYVIFDRQNKRVGFGQTTCSSNKDNTIKHSTVSEIQRVNYNTSVCFYIKPENNLTPLTVAAYVMVSLCVLFFLPIILFLVQCQYHRKCKKKPRNEELMIDDQLLDSELDSTR